VVEKAFVDVTNLFDLECAVTELTSLLDPPLGGIEDLESSQHVKHREVIDWDRYRRVNPPVLTDGSALEERESIGIKEAATVGRDTE
jgi:hypothetical protein